MIEIDKIYNEDCLVGMSKIDDKSIDCIICDLPYGVLNRNNKNCQWDQIIPFDKLWTQYERIIKDNGAIVLFAQGMFTAELMMSNRDLWRYNLIWKKGNSTSGFLNANRMPLRNHEDICVFYKSLPTYNPQMRKGTPSHSRGKAFKEKAPANNCYGNFKMTDTVITDDKFPLSVIDIQKECKSKCWHPTQKPVELLEYLIRTYTNEGGLILDNCMGSGTTAIGCLNTNRHFIGFEANQEYFEKANERILEQIKLKDKALF